MIKIGIIVVNTYLPMRSKFVNSYSIKSCASGFDELLESIFCILLVMGMFFLQKVIEVLEEVVVGWQEIRWIWRMNIQMTMKPSLFNFWSVGCPVCHRSFLLTSPVCRRCSFWCISLICWTYLADVKVSPGCGKLWWFIRAEDHQTLTVTFVWCKFDLAMGSSLGLLGPATELVIASWHIQSPLHHTSQSDREIVRCCCIE